MTKTKQKLSSPAPTHTNKTLPTFGPRVAKGEVGYLQRVVLTVDKELFDDEIYFWKNAMGMRATREVKGDEGKSVIFAFGQETLDADDGVGMRRPKPNANLYIYT